MWRGRLGLSCLFPALSSAGASLSRPCPVSTSRSSNRAWGFPAHGSRRKHHGFAHEKLRVRLVSRTSAKVSLKLAGGNFPVAGHGTLCLMHNH